MARVLETITKYRLAHRWTEYELSVRSGLPQSTISSWYRGDLSSDRFILFQHSLLCHKTATFMTFFIQL